MKPSRVGIFFAVFAVLLAAQAFLAWWLYRASREELLLVLTNEVERVAQAGARAIAAAGGSNAAAANLAGALKQYRDAERLAEALIVDADGKILADASGAPPGLPASALAVSPQLLARALNGEKALSIESLDEEPVRRWCELLPGDPRAVLCIELSDPLPAIGAALRRPALTAFGIAVLLAFVLALMALAVTRAIERARRSALAAERLAAAGSLAAGIAHEVKNPMSIILSATQELLSSEHMKPDDRMLLRDIEDEVRRADDQLNSFLDLVRDMPLKPTACDLGELARATVDLTAIRARASRVTLTCEAVVAPVLADHRRLRQALVNLILNAIEAYGVNGGLVRVVVERDDQRSLARVSVCDDGPGIPAHLLNSVLEDFVTTKPEGTGLGISSAKRTVERHGGRLELRSRPGSGTTVIVELPLARGNGGPPCAS